MSNTSPHIRFDYKVLRFIDANGDLQQALPETVDEQCLLRMYRWLCQCRWFDSKAVALQRTGQLGTYASSLGQEAYSVGVGLALKETDCLAPYYRDHAAQVIRGVQEREILGFWGGSERGSQFGQAPQQDFSNCIPIATQVTHAAGAALAYQLQDNGRAALATCGDGATSRGDFYESLNFAGVKKLPLVIYVNNNQWAISVPIEQQTACQTIAQKAVAAQVDSERVDGNDVVAVYDTVRRALHRARTGQGPTLIEGLSYRLCDHTTADDASRYSNADRLKHAWEQCPIARLKKYLMTQGMWTESQQKQLESEYDEHLHQEVEAYLHQSKEAATAIFDHLYAHLPYIYQIQRQELDHE